MREYTLDYCNFVKALVFPRWKDIIYLIKDKEYSIEQEPIRGRIIVRCEHKPSDGWLFGIKWIEYTRDMDNFGIFNNVRNDHRRSIYDL